MDGGLLFWLIIIAVAIAQAVGQKKKPTRSGAPAKTPPGPERPREEADSSEGMVPADVWEEILGLARGEPLERKEELPQEDNAAFTPEPAVEPAPDPVPAPAPDPAPAPRARKGLRTGGGESLSPVPTSTPRPVRRLENAQASAVLRPGLTREPKKHSGKARDPLFRDGSSEELRKAIILKEVLGPPLSLREE